MAKQNDTKEQILQAAARIIHTEGVLALTLEAAAKAAGVSKGGLLYHFPTKEVLIQSMTDYILAGFARQVENIAAADRKEAGKWTRAYIQETNNQIENELEMNAATLAALAVNPALLGAMQGPFAELVRRMENDHLNPVVAMVMKLAMDGMYYNQLYGVMPLDAAKRANVVNYLLMFTENA